jgi:hypothetical protein
MVEQLVASASDVFKFEYTMMVSRQGQLPVVKRMIWEEACLSAVRLGEDWKPAAHSLMRR